MKKIFAAMMVALALAACSLAPTVTAPTSIDQSLAYVRGTVTAIRNTAAASLSSGTITVAQAQQAEALAEKVDSAITLGQGENAAGDLTRATAQLALVTSALTALQQYLTTTKGQ